MIGHRFYCDLHSGRVVLCGSGEPDQLGATCWSMLDKEADMKIGTKDAANAGEMCCGNWHISFRNANPDT